MELVLHTLFTQLMDASQKNFTPHTLYVVATPIGNLADLTIRALAAFNRADIICAEDTRLTGNLLRTYGIQVKKLVSLREHNEQKMAERVIHWLTQGLIVVQVSDAGTPAIADPGARLAKTVQLAGFRICPIPGACAIVTALSASGLTTPSFLFHGFLPAKSTERRQQLAQWRTTPLLVVCYEAPHRIIATLKDSITELGSERILLLARELTKTFETIKTLPAGEMLQWMNANTQQQRGEIVLIIDAAPAKKYHNELDEATLRTLRTLAHELPTKQAVNLTAKLTGANKKTLYDYALTLKQADNG